MVEKTDYDIITDYSNKSNRTIAEGTTQRILK